jgi:hypothetical protein
MDNHNENTSNQTPKGPTPENESKPVGYGSSIQSDGHGNRTRPVNPDDANPTTQLDHIQDLKDGEVEEDATDRIPKTDGTGGNHPVANGDSVIIKED